ncbi:MAG: putative monovalent cation/H+ antiporter subunit A [Anaerolineae bacterium]|nr:putative monovalent cation/H+ antiporter subunit A [Anaerolineae bacterium]
MSDIVLTDSARVNSGQHRPWFGLFALIPLGFFLYFATLLHPVAAGEVVSLFLPWVPSLQVNLSFLIDGLGLYMGLIVSGIGVLVLMYASVYLRGEAEIGRFYTFILLFMVSMLGLVFSNNIFLLFICWELTSITSFFLIGFHHEEAKAQKAALQALLVTGAGGLAMMVGLMLLVSVTGTAEISAFKEMGGLIQSSSLYVPIVILVFLGAFTKSAQFPFHFWLPNAMAGPTPVSTYLHSATMVTAGVYLLARLNPSLSGTPLWSVTLMVVGGFTALLTAWLSWQKTDLKGILAYSTISALGVMVMMIGIGSEAALTTAVLFLLVHALYKAALFMGAGIIDHETGTRDVTQLGGLWKLMPFTFVGFLLASLSMAGIPPLLGFVSKELMYESTLGLNGQMVAWGATAVILLSNVFMVTAAGILTLRPFFGKVTAHKPHHKTPAALWLGPVILGSIALLLGLFASSTFVNELLVGTAVASVIGETTHLHLNLWHGFTPMLALSALTLTAGAFLYAAHTALRPAATHLDDTFAHVGPGRWYDLLFNDTLDFAEWLTMRLQNGHLRSYLFYVLNTFLLLVGFTFVRQINSHSLPAFTPIRPYEGIILLVIAAAAWTVVRFDSRLAVIAALGVIGYGIAVLYILFGAPDLAMTQFSVETLTVILFVLVLYRLPAFDKFSSKSTRLRDGIIAGLVGLLMTGLVLATQALPGNTSLKDYFSNNAYLLAKGHNVVNVILVDFRGFDTMVEITVLSVAAIGVYALLKSRPQNRLKENEDHHQ